MNRVARSLSLVVAMTGAMSCSDDVDYVHVIVTGIDSRLAVSPLDLRVTAAGGGRSSSFSYTAALKTTRAAERPQVVSDFTVSFGEVAGGVVDLSIVTRPSGDAVDWGGDARIALPGAGRTVTIPIARGEQNLLTVDPLDGDVITAAPYGGQLVLAWPTLGRRVGVLALDPDRPQGLERPPELGEAASKVRVASRPSSDFTSELFVTTWLEHGATPMLKSETRTQEFDAKPIGGGARAADVHVACARREFSPAIVTATLRDGRVAVHAHDETGTSRGGPFEPPELTRVNRIAGVAVTPDETVTLAVNGDGARLVQVSLRTGAVVHVEPLSGQVASMSPSSDGTRLLVATVVGIGEQATLAVDTFSVRPPKRTQVEPSVVSRFPFVVGVPVSRVTLASCAMAWPERRDDGTDGVDIRYLELDLDGRPKGAARLANVSRSGVHYAPTVVCLSATRAFITFFGASGVGASGTGLKLRRIPLGF